MNTPLPRVPPGDAAVAWTEARRITVAGSSIRYREAGRGPVVVLVHGLGMSADYWFRNGPALAAGFRVLAPDLPGFGRTAGPAAGLSVPRQAEALIDWARAMRLPPAVYVGHSLACQSVLEMAARSPETVRALVLAAPTGDRGRVRRALRQLAGLLVDATREPLPLFPVVLRDYLRAGPVRIWNTWRLGTRHDPLGLLAEVRGPALVVVGDRDPVVPVEFARTLARGIPCGRFACIAGGAHAVHFDRADAFNRELLRFLGEATRREPHPDGPRSPSRGAEGAARGAR